MIQGSAQRGDIIPLEVDNQRKCLMEEDSR